MTHGVNPTRLERRPVAAVALPILHIAFCASAVWSMFLCNLFALWFCHHFVDGCWRQYFFPTWFLPIHGSRFLGVAGFCQGTPSIYFFGGKAGHMSKPLARGEFAVVSWECYEHPNIVDVLLRTARPIPFCRTKSKNIRAASTMLTWPQKSTAALNASIFNAFYVK